MNYDINFTIKAGAGQITFPIYRVPVSGAVVPLEPSEIENLMVSIDKQVLEASQSGVNVTAAYSDVAEGKHVVAVSGSLNNASFYLLYGVRAEELGVPAEVTAPNAYVSLEPTGEGTIEQQLQALRERMTAAEGDIDDLEAAVLGITTNYATKAEMQETLGEILAAIQALPDGQAVSAQVALNTAAIEALQGEVSQLGQEVIYDVTLNNPTAGPNNNGKFESLSELLSDANLSTLIPSAVRCGGMSVRFVQISDNKYIQARCMAQNFTTDVTQWQGVDDTPEPNSQDLVKGGGIFQITSKLFLQYSEDIVKNLENIDYIQESLTKTVINGKAINANGEIYDLSGYNICSFDCSFGELYQLLRIAVSPVDNIMIAVLDANNTIITSLTGREVGGNNKYIIAPYGAAKIMYVSTNTSPIVRRYVIKHKEKFLWDCNKALAKLSEGFSSVELTNDEMSEYGIIKNGIVEVFSEKYVTPIYPYNQNNIYVYSGTGAYDISPAAYYDGDGNLLGVASTISGVVSNLTLNNIPEGTKGIRFCSYGGTFIVKIKTPLGTKLDNMSEVINDLKDEIEEGKSNKLTLDFSEDGTSEIISNFNATDTLKQTFVLNPSTMNRCFNFGDVYRVNKTTLVETLCKNMVDDICPVSFGTADYIGANHGAYCLNDITCNNHDKTFDDIGSVWSDGTHTFTIVGIKDANHIYVIGENTMTYPSFTFASPASSGTLTHVSGATHTSDIVFTAKSIGQWAPFYKNVPQKSIYLDDKQITESGDYTFGVLRITENYEILNPASVVDKIKDAVGTFTSNPTPQDFANSADVLLGISNTYTFTSAAMCFVATSLNLIQQSSFDHFGFTQCIAFDGSNPKIYIPKAKSKGNGATSVGYRTIVPWSEANGLIRTGDWEDASLPPDRILGFDDNLGIYIGYMFDYGVGGNMRSASLAGNTAIYIGTNKKLYPFGWSTPVGTPITGTYQNRSAVCFRKFVDRNSINVNGVIDATVFEYGGKCYIYADFNAVGDYEIAIPSKYYGLQVEVLEKRDNVILTTQNASNVIKLHISEDEVMYGYFVGRI